MPYNYRKNAGRFGDDDGGDRPPVRPAAAFPNARRVIDVTPQGLFFHDPSNEDPILAQQMFNPNTICNDDVSSLGNDGATVCEVPEIPVEDLLNNPGAWKQIQGQAMLDPSSINHSNGTNIKKPALATPAFAVQVDPGEAEPPFAEEELTVPTGSQLPMSSVAAATTTTTPRSPTKTTTESTKTKRIKKKSAEKASQDPEKRERRKKKKTVTGSVTSSEPSTTKERRDGKVAAKKRVKKKIRSSKPSSSSTPNSPKKDSSERRKARGTARESHGTKSTKTRRRSKSRPSKNQRPVSPQEILDFVNSSNDLDYNASSSSQQVFEDIALEPAQRAPISPQDTREASHIVMQDHFDDFDGIGDFSPPTFQHAISFAMTVNPELTDTKPKPKRNIVYEDDDETSWEGVEMGRSLEMAITSKPKDRSQGKSRKKKGHTFILQKMFGGNGTRGRGTQ